MATPPPTRYILSAGFGRYATHDPNALARFGPDAGHKVKELLARSISQARAAGFEVLPTDINPEDPADSLKRFVEALQSREWSGVNVGFGVRGHKENTVLFERMLGEVRRLAPGARVVFSNGPDELFEAIRRNFLDGGE
ncbi:hypothetical protein LTR08_002691 [Meristemomyces frigidus]|nr:hypothetical protein LTR08_002691 [Meristemomyces frigidus]